jgi:hypothetical protein
MLAEISTDSDVLIDKKKWFLDVPSGIVGVFNGMILSLSVLASGDGGTDDACGRSAFLGAWGDAAVEAGRTTAGY